MDNMKLYQYTEEFQQLIDFMEENDLSREDLADTIEAIQLSAEDKIKNTGKVIRMKNDNIEIMKKRKNEIDEMIKRETKQVQSLKEYLLFNMNQLEVKKVQDTDITVSVRKSKSMVITDENKLPEEYIKTVTEVKPDKAGFKKYYNSLTEEEQAKIDFAYLAENESINIK